MCDDKGLFISSRSRKGGAVGLHPETFSIPFLYTHVGRGRISVSKAGGTEKRILLLPHGAQIYD